MTTKLSLLLPTLLAFGCPQPPLQRPESPVSPPAKPSVDTEQPWRDLAIGELAAAASGFAALREAADAGLRQQGLAGGLRVALVQRDAAVARRLLAELPDAPSEANLLVAAALAQLRFAPGELGDHALARRACALAKPEAVAAGERLAVDALNVCSQLALATTVTGPQRRCVGGCDGSSSEHRFPLSLIGTQPVIHVSVNGQPPAPFVVDTGASSSLLTKRFAAKIGVKAAPGSRWRVGSPGGMLTAHRAAVNLKLGGLALEAVPVILIELPFQGIAGLISPHDSFGQLVTTFDFRAMAMVVGGKVPRGKGEPMVSWPLIIADGNPAVRVSVGGRPARALLIDTGAFKTTLSVKLDELGEPMPRGGEGRVAGAGGKGARSWATKATVAARAGDLSWSMERPTLTQREHHTFSDVEYFGLLGMDFLIGRLLTVDLPGKRLLVSREAKLSPWPVEASARFEMLGDHFAGREVTLSERVVASDGKAVTLEVSIDRRRTRRGRIKRVKLAGPAKERFRLTMSDSWGSRGSWLITRPARPVEGDAKQLRARWARLMGSFGTTGKNPSIKMERFKLGDRELACTRTGIDALIGKRPARLEILECPRSPWRMTAMELREGAKLRWGFRRVR